MNNIFLTLKAKRIPFEFQSDSKGNVTHISHIILTRRNKMHFANGRRISGILYNELLKLK